MFFTFYQKSVENTTGKWCDLGYGQNMIRAQYESGLKDGAGEI